ncbi:hypothetical protein HH110_18150 [Stenotrophomonas sp. SAM-B]|uniref:hypothetical protein n=1 Tax=Stenotrophomonas sp. SAM-B TaxID=2729141 RepID=UPI0015A37CA6|nr:hypothetical protein [Stenotrophomonas sp. SAM-B]NWF34955.1 hypothetical protein [Stenotrophomonas sp. SAM-B]
MFTARLAVDRAAVRTLRQHAACTQVASHVAAIAASAHRDGAVFFAPHDDVKKVLSEYVDLSAIVHLQRFLRFQMKVKILKSH